MWWSETSKNNVYRRARIRWATVRNRSQDELLAKVTRTSAAAAKAWTFSCRRTARLTEVRKCLSPMALCRPVPAPVGWSR